MTGAGDEHLGRRDSTSGRVGELSRSLLGASLVDGCCWLSRRTLGRPWEYRDDFGALHNDVHWQREAVSECDDARPQRESRWEVPCRRCEIRSPGRFWS